MPLEATVLTGQNIFIECDYNFLSRTVLTNYSNQMPALALQHSIISKTAHHIY